jgi:hypothetical protein
VVLGVAGSSPVTHPTLLKSPGAIFVTPGPFRSSGRFAF